MPEHFWTAKHRVSVRLLIFVFVLLFSVLLVSVLLIGLASRKSQASHIGGSDVETTSFGLPDSLNLSYGQQFTAYYRVKNIGTQTVTDLGFKVQVFHDFTVQSLAVSVGSCDSNTLTCTLPPVAVGQDVIFEVQTLAPNHDVNLGATISSAVTTSFCSSADFNLCFSEKTFVTRVRQSYTGFLGTDLTVVGSDSPDPATVPQPLSYTFTVTNLGPERDRVNLVTMLSPLLQFSTAPRSCMQSPSEPRKIVCALDTLSSNQSVVQTITANPLFGGMIESTGSAVGSPTDPNTANNVTTVSTTVIGPTPSCTVSLPESVTVTVGQPGETVTATVTTTGPTTVSQVYFQSYLGGGVFTISPNSDTTPTYQTTVSGTLAGPSGSVLAGAYLSTGQVCYSNYMSVNIVAAPTPTATRTPTPTATMTLTPTSTPTGTPTPTPGSGQVACSYAPGTSTGAGTYVDTQAESYNARTTGTGSAAGKTWTATTAYSGYTNTAAMQALTNTGVNTGDSTIGPRLDFRLRFPTSLTYPRTLYLYARGRAVDGSSDSIHMGINGNPVTYGQYGLTGFVNTGFTWRSTFNGSPAAVTVPSAGDHVINVWMREDGTIIDEIVASTVTGLSTTILNGLADSGQDCSPTATPTPTTTPAKISSPTPTLAPVTLSRRVAAGSDDAEERTSDKYVTLTSSDLELGYDASTAQIVGMRFRDIQIPRGKTITSAFIEFQVDESDTKTTSVTFWGHKTGNSATFSKSSGNLSSRAKTTARVTWSIPVWTTVGTKYKTPDLKTLIQELINQSTWVSRNAITILAAGTGERTAESFEGLSSAAPMLVIKY